MAYLVFNVDSLKILGAYQTVGEAQAAAAVNNETTYTIDSFTLPNRFMSPTDNLWYYYDGEIQPEARETNQDRLRSAAKHSHLRLHNLSQMIRKEAVGHHSTVAAKGHNFIAGAFRAFYIILHRTNYIDSEGDEQNYMIDQKVAFCNAFPAPEEVIVNARSFLLNASASDLPTGPITWVDPRTATSVTLSQSIALSGPSPSDGSAYNLNLLASEIPDTANFLDGGWTYDLTIRLWGPPTNFAATRTLSNVIFLEWDVPDDMGDEPLTNYILQFKPSSAADTEWESRSLPTFLPGVQSAGLTPNTQYDFRIASMSESGQGPWSPVLQATTMA